VDRDGSPHPAATQAESVGVEDGWRLNRLKLTLTEPVQLAGLRPHLRYDDAASGRRLSRLPRAGAAAASDAGVGAELGLVTLARPRHHNNDPRRIVGNFANSGLNWCS
jgi:hypothetical protein